MLTSIRRETEAQELDLKSNAEVSQRRNITEISSGHIPYCLEHSEYRVLRHVNKVKMPNITSVALKDRLLMVQDTYLVNQLSRRSKIVSI